MMREYRVCQFCRKLSSTDFMTYYAMRHWAHGTCLVEHLTAGRILRLKTFTLKRLPALALKEFNMLELVEKELAKRREAACVTGSI